MDIDNEIKYRVWDKKEEEMVYTDMILLSHWGIDKIQYYFGSSNNFPVMRYSGVEDKNGEEIYESDIIRTGLGEWLEIKYGKQDVSHDFQGIGFYTENKEKDFKLAGNFWEGMGGIVGNIYEDPRWQKK